MVTLHCEYCGAPLDRDPDKRLGHTWHFRTPQGTCRRGVMIGYACHRHHGILGAPIWGKLRAVTFEVPESAVPESER